MSRPYVPINCEFHDVLEAVATQRRVVAIVIEDEHGEASTLQARIVDITAHAGVETMRLDDDRQVRLDAIVSVDGVRRDAFADACGVMRSSH